MDAEMLQAIGALLVAHLALFGSLLWWQMSIMERRKRFGDAHGPQPPGGADLAPRSRPPRQWASRVPPVTRVRK